MNENITDYNVTCGKCKHEQIANYNNTYQDIKGKFIVCVKCDGFINVEVEIDFY